jgi:hypothetical protein
VGQDSRSDRSFFRSFGSTTQKGCRGWLLIGPPPCPFSSSAGDSWPRCSRPTNVEKEDLVKGRAGGGEGTCADGRGYTPGKHDDGGDDDWIDSWKRRRRRRGQRRRRGRAGRRRAEFALRRRRRTRVWPRDEWCGPLPCGAGSDTDGSKIVVEKVKIGSCVGVKRQAGPGPG